MPNDNTIQNNPLSPEDQNLMGSIQRRQEVAEIAASKTNISPDISNQQSVLEKTFPNAPLRVSVGQERRVSTGAFGELGAGIVRGSINTVGGVARTFSELGGGVKPGSLASKVDEWSRTHQDIMGQPDYDGLFDWSAGMIGEQVPFMATLFASGGTTGALAGALKLGVAGTRMVTTAGALATISAQTYGDNVDGIRRASNGRLTENQIHGMGALSTFIQAAAELVLGPEAMIGKAGAMSAIEKSAIPFAKQLAFAEKKSPFSTFKGKALEALVFEPGTEVVQALTQSMWENVASETTMTKEQFSEAFQQGLAAIPSSAFFGGVSAVAEWRVRNRILDKRRSIDTNKEIIASRFATEEEAQSALLATDEAFAKFGAGLSDRFGATGGAAIADGMKEQAYHWASETMRMPEEYIAEFGTFFTDTTLTGQQISELRKQATPDARAEWMRKNVQGFRSFENKETESYRTDALNKQYDTELQRYRSMFGAEFFPEAATSAEFTGNMLADQIDSQTESKKPQTPDEMAKRAMDIRIEALHRLYELRQKALESVSNVKADNRDAYRQLSGITRQTARDMFRSLFDPDENSSWITEDGMRNTLANLIYIDNSRISREDAYSIAEQLGTQRAEGQKYSELEAAFMVQAVGSEKGKHYSQQELSEALSTLKDNDNAWKSIVSQERGMDQYRELLDAARDSGASAAQRAGIALSQAATLFSRSKNLVGMNPDTETTILASRDLAAALRQAVQDGENIRVIESMTDALNQNIDDLMARINEAREQSLRVNKALRDLQPMESSTAAQDGDVRTFAERMAAGEKMESPEDLQFYQNNAQAIEAELKNIADGISSDPVTEGELYAQYDPERKLAVFFANATAEDVLHEWFHHVEISGLLPENMQREMDKTYGITANSTPEERRIAREKSARDFLLYLKQTADSGTTKGGPMRYPKSMDDTFAYLHAVFAAEFKADMGVPKTGATESAVAYQGGAIYDNPSLDYVGTGEGAQAFGYGLYYTERFGIAKQYAQSFSEKNRDGNSSAVHKVTLFDGKGPHEYNMLSWYDAVDPEIVEPIADAYIKKYQNLFGSKLIKEVDGNEISIRDELGHLIFRWGIDKYNVPTGQDMYDDLSIKLGSKKDASELLLQNGVDGIVYPAETLKGGSRDLVVGNRNFVMFDTKDIKKLSMKQFSPDLQVFSDNVIDYNPEVRSFFEGAFDNATIEKHHEIAAKILAQSQRENPPNNPEPYSVYESATAANITDPKKLWSLAHKYKGPSGDAQVDLRTYVAKVLGLPESKVPHAKPLWEKMTLAQQQQVAQMAVDYNAKKGNAATKQQMDAIAIGIDPNAKQWSDLGPEDMKKAQQLLDGMFEANKSKMLDDIMKAASEDRRRQIAHRAMEEFNSEMDVVSGINTERRGVGKGEGEIVRRTYRFLDDLKAAGRSAGNFVSGRGVSGQAPQSGLMASLQRMKRTVGAWIETRTDDANGLLDYLDDGRQNGPFRKLIGRMLNGAVQNYARARQESAGWLVEYGDRHGAHPSQHEWSEEHSFGRDGIVLTVEEAAYIYMYTNRGRSKDDVKALFGSNRKLKGTDSDSIIHAVNMFCEGGGKNGFVRYVKKIGPNNYLHSKKPLPGYERTVPIRNYARTMMDYMRSIYPELDKVHFERTGKHLGNLFANGREFFAPGMRKGENWMRGSGLTDLFIVDEEARQDLVSQMFSGKYGQDVTIDKLTEPERQQVYALEDLHSEKYGLSPGSKIDSRSQTVGILEKRSAGHVGAELAMETVSIFEQYRDQADIYRAKTKALDHLDLVTRQEDFRIGLENRVGADVAGMFHDAIREMINRERFPGGRTYIDGELDQVVRDMQAMVMPAVLARASSMVLQTASGIRVLAEIPLMDSVKFARNTMKIMRQVAGNRKRLVDALLMRDNVLSGDTEVGRWLQHMVESSPKILERMIGPDIQDYYSSSRRRRGVANIPIGRSSMIEAQLGGLRVMDIATVLSVYHTAYESKVSELGRNVAKGKVRMTDEQIEKAATDFADDVVRRTQPGSTIVDRSLLQTARPTTRMWIPFTGDTMKQFQFLRRDIWAPIQRGIREGGAKGLMKALLTTEYSQSPVGKRILFMSILPMTVVSLIKRRRAPEDAEEWMEDMLGLTVSTIPIIGPMFSNAITGNFSIDGTPIALMPVIAAAKAMQSFKKEGLYNEKGYLNERGIDEFFKSLSTKTGYPLVFNNFVKEMLLMMGNSDAFGPDDRTNIQKSLDALSVPVAPLPAD